jgi:hypothetical protein
MMSPKVFNGGHLQVRAEAFHVVLPL